MNNIYLQLLEIQPKESSLVIATVTKSVGSTPQKPGSSALFDASGLLYGTVGGGVLEGEVQKIAQKAIVSKESDYCNFKLDTELHQGIGAICGGQANVLVDASPEDHRLVLEQMKESLKRRISGVLVSMISGIGDKKVTIQRFWLTEDKKNVIPNDQGWRIEIEAQRLLAGKDQSDFQEINIDVPGEDHNILFFLEPIHPPAHLVIAGAGHIGKALSHIGKLLDFEVTVIDEREEYANAANLPDADHIIAEDVGKAMDEITLAADTFVVIVTRGHKDDTKALRACVGSDAAYIGMIGSRNKISTMRTEFIQHGWAEPSEWKDIHAPIGLDIQSKSVQEIAISIAAQLIQVKNSKIPAYV
jgi:xanthine dehydrogenase accessory factor